MSSNCLGVWVVCVKLQWACVCEWVHTRRLFYTFHTFNARPYVSLCCVYLSSSLLVTHWLLMPTLIVWRPHAKNYTSNPPSCARKWCCIVDDNANTKHNTLYWNCIQTTRCLFRSIWISSVQCTEMKTLTTTRNQTKQQTPRETMTTRNKTKTMLISKG